MRTRRRCGRFVLFVLLLPVPAPAQQFLLSGTVSGPAGPVAGAAVTIRATQEFGGEVLLETTLTSDAAGAFAASIPRSSVDLRAEPPMELGLDSAQVSGLLVSEDLAVRLVTAPLVTLSGSVTVPSGRPRPAQLEIRSLTADRYETAGVDGNGKFETRIRADVYTIRPAYRDSILAGRVNVDATAGDARGISLAVAPLDEVNPFAIADAPRADRISFSTPDEMGNLVVTGTPGAVEPLSSVLVGNRSTGNINLVASRADGSFTAGLFAPAGSPVMVRHDPTGLHLSTLQVGGPGVSSNLAPGTTLYVPIPAGRFACAGPIGGAFESLQLSAARSIGVTDTGAWTLEGSLPEGPITPGIPFTYRGTLTLFLRDVGTAEEASALQVNTSVDLEQIVDGDGRPRRHSNQFASTFMTPSGLPIERRAPMSGLGEIGIGPLRLVRPGTVETDWTLDGWLPVDTPAGVYRPRLKVWVNGLPSPARYFDLFPVMGQTFALDGSLPLIRVGSVPFRMLWVLALDSFSNGSRGAVALEDRGKAGISSKVLTNSDRFVVPLRDERTGQRARLRLEPYAPLLSITTGNGGTPETPQVALRFPSGSLTATVWKPDGTVDTIGPAPFAQLAFRTPASRTGLSLTNATNHANDFHQLVTNDPRFDYAFSQWGRHVITLQGTVEDLYGNTFEGSGTYEVDVARPLDIETAILPGTPFEPGDTLSTAVQLDPPAPADVTVTVRHYPDSDAEGVEIQEVRGVANRFGHFRAHPIRLDTPGEYRVDVRADRVDPSGVHWAGAASWGGVVVTPGSELITHGRRGFDGVERIQQQWLSVREARAGGDHLMFPFHGGDVMWMQKDDPAADIPKITVQDPSGAFAQRVRSRSQLTGAAWESPGIEERITAGEIPLFSTQRGPFDEVEQWGYFYAAVSRPGVRVRELISEDESGTGYWRFSDAYGLQLGNGIGGDFPNDFKFQFGGAVWRDQTDGFRYYGGYASLFVLLPFDDERGGRVMPPFRGNGGGPDGGPLFRLKERDIELFFHPTALRPGTILHRGQRVSFAGYSAPPLASTIEITVTSPSGAVRTIRGRANRFGWFFDPAQDFIAGESGVWTAAVKIAFDGRVSAGQLTEPFPAGDVLGSRAGEFSFYVVDADAPQVDVAVSPQIPGPATAFVRSADGPITFTVTKPEGWTALELRVTTTMPGFILEEGVQTALTYRYDAQELAKDFPNLDLHDADGFAGADSIAVSLLLSGTDGAGARRHAARQITIQGEELQVPDQRPRPKRRAVR